MSICIMLFAIMYNVEIVILTVYVCVYYVTWSDKIGVIIVFTIFITNTKLHVLIMTLATS